MYCMSVRFQRGMADSAFYSLDLTMLASGINGELAPNFGATYSHFSYLDLTDQLFGDHIPGAMGLNVPAGGDANDNGWSDFFEVVQPVSVNSSGAYNIPGLSSGTVQTSWSRAAGSPFGLCVLVFKESGLYTWETFRSTFEVIEYAGPLAYTPAANTVTGAVNLVKTGDLASTFQGPAVFVKSPTNLFNQLELQPGAWTNAAVQTLTFMQDTYVRDLTHPTNYYGYFDFDDGEPNTADPDYYTWVLSIDDPNDTDHDGIPDFSDTPAAALPRRPSLTLSRGTTNLLLTIRGDTNHMHRVQEITNVLSTNWQIVVSVTLTNDPQTVSLPLPASSPRFWRVRAE